MTMRALGILTASAMAVALVGCGEEGTGRDDTGGDMALPVGDPTYDVDAPSWAVGDTIHVGKWSVTVNPAPDAYVVADRGIYYVAKDVLHFTDGHNPVREVGPIASSTMVESADGRYLGMMAEAESSEDEYGTPPRVPVVFDLETGSEILRAEPGEVSEDDDLADLYEDASVGFLGFADDAAYADDPLRDGATRFPLDGGKPESAPVDDFGLAELPTFAGERGVEVTVQPANGGGYEISETGDGYSGVLSPDERYLFVDGDGRGTVFYDAESGESIRFDPGLRDFRLGGWVDDETFYGATSSRGNAEFPAGRVRIVSCTTTTRSCTPVGPEFGLPADTFLLFGTGNGPYFA